MTIDQFKHKMKSMDEQFSYRIESLPNNFTIGVVFFNGEEIARHELESRSIE